MAVDELFSFSFSPDAARIQIAFEDWSKEIKDWRPAWRDITRMFRKHEKRHLNSEGRTTGQEFPPLSARYAKWKKKNYPGRPILKREKVLFRALVQGDQGSINVVARRFMVVGIDPNAVLRDPRTGKPYHLGKAAKAHSAGIPPHPKRPPVRIDPNVQSRASFGYAVSQIMQAHIVKARRKAMAKDIEAAIGGVPVHAGPDATIRKMIDGKWK